MTDLPPFFKKIFDMSMASRGLSFFLVGGGGEQKVARNMHISTSNQAFNFIVYMDGVNGK